MAIEKTLVDVIERLKAEGSMVRNGHNSIKSLKETIQSGNVQSLNHLKDINNTITLGQFKMEELIDIFTGQKLQEKEDKREENVYRQMLLEKISGLGDKIKTEKKKEKEDTSGVFDSFLGALAAGLVGSVSGVIAGFVVTEFTTAFQTVGFLIKGFGKALTSAVDLIIKPLKSIFPNIKNPLRMFSDTIKSASKWLKISFAMTKANILTYMDEVIATFKVMKEAAYLKLSNAFSGIGDKFPKVFEKLSGIKSSLTSYMDEVSKTFRAFTGSFKGLFSGVSGGSMFAPLKKVFGTISNISSKMFGALDEVAGVFKTAFGFVKKLAWPLQAVIAFADTVKGAIEGYKEEGLIGAAKGAITGLFNSLVFSLFDLIKDGASWIADKVGLEGISEMLDSFSFTESFEKIVDSVFEFFGKAVDGLVSLFKGEVSVDDMLKGIGNMADMANDLLKYILKSSLPNPNGDYGLFDPRYYAAKAIPDSIYEYAGINPKTGEDIQKAPEASGIRSASSEVIDGSAEIAKPQQQAPIVIQQSDNSSKNVSSNTSNVTYNASFQEANETNIFSASHR